MIRPFPCHTTCNLNVESDDKYFISLNYIIPQGEFKILMRQLLHHVLIVLEHTTVYTPNPVSVSWGYSSVVEHSTADREVPGSNPGAPFFSE